MNHSEFTENITRAYVSDHYTFKDLTHWYNKLMKEFGNVYLEKLEGKDVGIYKNHIRNFMQCSQTKYTLLSCPDKKEDLLIMNNKIKKLLSAII